MEKGPSFIELALAGVERVRALDCGSRSRAAALLLLLRGAYATGEEKWRALAEEDLRALWRGGVHDHIGGGFFSASVDAEWLRPRFEKRLDDNAILAFVYAEAWEKGRMGFYRAAAEEALDWVLRELATPGGLYGAGQKAEKEGEENPFLFTPARIAEILPGDEGRHFAACYDITAEDNCPGGSIPNLILNQRWSLVPEGYDDLRERVRLAREQRSGLATDLRCPFDGNALLLAALAKAARVFSDRRYLAAAEELAEKLLAAEPPRALLARAALLFALTELYAADFEPARLAAAAALAGSLDGAEYRRDKKPSPARDRALSLTSLGLDALWRLTGEESLLSRRIGILLALGKHPEQFGPESLSALCMDLEGPRALLCVSPGEEPPAALAALRSRYAPDLAVLLRTPARAASLAAAAPWTAAAPIGSETLFYPREGGKIGAPHRL